MPRKQNPESVTHSHTCCNKTKSFPDKASSGVHVRIVHHAKMFECEICQRIFSKPWSLKRHHQNIHSGVKAFTCHLCPYKTAVEYQLKQHQVIHSGVKAFSCDFCPYQTAYKFHLKRHSSIHSGFKGFTFNCHLCPYKNADEYQVKRHLMIHSGVKGYTCHICPYKTAHVFALKRHLRVHDKGNESVAQQQPPMKIDLMDTSRDMSKKHNLSTTNDLKKSAGGASISTSSNPKLAHSIDSILNHNPVRSNHQILTSSWIKSQYFYQNEQEIEKQIKNKTA